MKLDPPPILNSWRFILLLVSVGIIIRLAFPAMNSLVSVFILFVVLVFLFFRKPLINYFANGLGARRTNMFLFSEEYEKAVDFSTEQITKNPKDIVAYLTRSTAYIHLGNLAAARSDCDMALTLDPKSVYTLNNRAVIAMQQDNLPAALADMKQALTLQPDNPILLYGQGSVYARMGKDEDALKDFEAAIDNEPDQAVTYVGRGHIAFKQGDVASALKDYRKACELAEETHQFSAALAVAEFASGEVVAAQKRWQALPTTYSHYTDPDWQRRVLGWPDVLTVAAGKLIAHVNTKISNA